MGVLHLSGEQGEPAASIVWMSGARVINDEELFLSVRITSLAADAVTDFDLYMRPNEDASPVLYREQNLAFTEEDRNRLQESGVVELLVRETDESKFRPYIESNLMRSMSFDYYMCTHRVNACYFGVARARQRVRWQ